jgi:ABC-type sugar transport system substrate-binding protein
MVGNLWVGGAWAASVVFLNPGAAPDPYWSSYSRFMQSAADKLGMDLRIYYTSRDTRILLGYARDALQGVDRPDYLVFSNELNVAPEILRLSVGSGVKLMAVNNTFTANQLEILGDLSKGYPDFLGSLVGNDEEGGYLSATRLIELHPPATPGEPIEMLAFSGTNGTPVSLLREKGMLRAVAEHPHVRLRQVVLGGWRRDRAEEQALMLLKRYPKVTLIWAANDLMAFGAMDAVKAFSKQPGKDVLFGAINDSTAALQAQLEERLNVVVGGHFTLGGWALVLLHDYDQAAPGTRRPIGDMRVRSLQLKERRDVMSYMSANLRDDYGIDVRQYTRGRSPEGLDSPFLPAHSTH